MSDSTLANNVYTTVFIPGNDGVDVFRANGIVISSMAPPALHGWRDGRGPWMVPVVDDNPISPGLDVTETAMGMCELPSTKEGDFSMLLWEIPLKLRYLPRPNMAT